MLEFRQVNAAMVSEAKCQRGGNCTKKERCQSAKGSLNLWLSADLCM